MGLKKDVRQTASVNDLITLDEAWDARKKYKFAEYIEASVKTGEKRMFPFMVAIREVIERREASKIVKKESCCAIF